MIQNLYKSESLVYIPDNVDPTTAFSRTTHMAISAHPDDIEFMAYDGILQCFKQENQWFHGVVITDGGGSPRSGIYSDFSDEKMKNVRIFEQKKAAYIGEYGALTMLCYNSSEAKDPKNCNILSDLNHIISLSKPDIIYTHNLADKHSTHVAVALKVIKTLRMLPKELRPHQLYGCEVWRSLDWLNDNEKVVFDVGSRPNLSSALTGVYDSQINSGKRYDLAIEGRRLSNATFFQSHSIDTSSEFIYGMDLTPLIKDISIDIADYITSYIKNFEKSVLDQIKSLL